MTDRQENEPSSFFISTRNLSTFSLAPHFLHLYPNAFITSFGDFKSNPEYIAAPQAMHAISKVTTRTAVNHLKSVPETLSSVGLG